MATTRNVATRRGVMTPVAGGARGGGRGRGAGGRGRGRGPDPGRGRGGAAARGAPRPPSPSESTTTGLVTVAEVWQPEAPLALPVHPRRQPRSGFW